MDYAVVIRPIPENEGGGYLALYPDLMGCVADGDTVEEALANSKDALAEWMETNNRRGRPIPAPGTAEKRFAEKRAKSARKIRDLEKSYEALNQRIEGIEENLAELREFAESAAAEERFYAIAGYTPEGNARKRSSEHC